MWLGGGFCFFVVGSHRLGVGFVGGVGVGVSLGFWGATEELFLSFLWRGFFLG